MTRRGSQPRLSSRRGPFRQGDLDGLCGLYSAVNAICLVLAPHRPLSRNQPRALFRRGITHLRDRGRLAKTIKDGMPPKWLWQLTKDLARYARQLTCVEVIVKRPARRTKPFTRQALLHAFDSALDSGAVIIVALEKALNHYTVIGGRTDRRYHLFDSIGLTWIRRESLGSRHTRTTRRHQIGREAILVVSAEERHPGAASISAVPLADSLTSPDRAPELTCAPEGTKAVGLKGNLRMSARNTRRGAWKALRQHQKPTRRISAASYNPKTGKMSSLPYGRKRLCDSDEVTIDDKLGPRQAKKRKPRRRPPFMTRQSAREIAEVLRAEARFGRIVPEGEVTVEDILAAEGLDGADRSNDE